MNSRRISVSLWAFFLAMPLAFAQQPAAPAPPTGPAAPMPPGKHVAPDRHNDREMDRKGMMGGAHDGGMGIVPPGTWWRNPNTIASLSLTADQQKKMDEIFRQNRLQLIDIKASLEKEQINLEPLLNANPVDSTKALAEIGKIAELRADLEKADAKMLLGLRALLTADQWTKLQADQHSHHERPMDDHRPKSGGPGGPGQQGGPGPQGPRSE